MSEALFEQVTAHCFWGWCNHTVTGLDPDAVHDAMEAHYASIHRADLDAIYPTAAAATRKVGDLVELSIGTKAMKKYRITSVTDDQHFEVEPW